MRRRLLDRVSLASIGRVLNGYRHVVDDGITWAFLRALKDSL
jgi:hypothetical protein